MKPVLLMGDLCMMKKCSMEFWPIYDCRSVFLFSCYYLVSSILVSTRPSDLGRSKVLISLTERRFGSERQPSTKLVFLMMPLDYDLVMREMSQVLLKISHIKWMESDFLGSWGLNSVFKEKHWIIKLSMKILYIIHKANFGFPLYFNLVSMSPP